MFVYLITNTASGKYYVGKLCLATEVTKERMRAAQVIRRAAEKGELPNVV